jgi:hypothetical protein
MLILVSHHYNLDLRKQLTRGNAASFDSYGLFTDMYNNPQNYFNGTAPYNVTGCINSCVHTMNSTAAPTCTVANGTDADSFLWSVQRSVLNSDLELTCHLGMTNFTHRSSPTGSWLGR